MKKLELHKQFRIQKGGSAWSEQLDQFLARLNPARIKDGYPPLDHGRLGRYLKSAGVSTAEDAYLLYRECDKAKHFGKLFWWKVLSKK